MSYSVLGGGGNNTVGEARNEVRRRCKASLVKPRNSFKEGKESRQNNARN